MEPLLGSLGLQSPLISLGSTFLDLLIHIFNPVQVDRIPDGPHWIMFLIPSGEPHPEGPYLNSHVRIPTQPSLVVPLDTGAGQVDTGLRVSHVV